MHPLLLHPEFTDMRCAGGIVSEIPHTSDALLITILLSFYFFKPVIIDKTLAITYFALIPSFSWWNADILITSASICLSEKPDKTEVYSTVG